MARIVAVLAITLGLCLSSLPGMAAQDQVPLVALYRATDRQQILEAGARREGRLLLYSALSLEEANPLLEAFTRRYPFVRAEIYRASTEDVALKVITEYRGRKYLADVVELSSIDLGKVQKEGILTPFASPRSGAYPRSAKSPEGYWVMTRANMLVAGYNTRAVAPADAPKSYDDLLQSRWQGKVAVEADDQIWLASLWDFWGEGKAREYFSRLGRQGLQVRKGHSALAELIAAGEVPLSPHVYNHRAEQLKRRGAPIDWAVLDPVVAVPQMIGLPRRAANPHAAMLFIDYMLSSEGQAVLAKLGRVVAHPFVPSDPPYLGRGFRYVTIDPAKFLSQFDFYNRLWEELLVRGGR